MTVLPPLLGLVGVIIGAGLAYLFTTLGERRRERWALSREWRERKLQAYGRYLSDVKRMRDLAQRIAAASGLDDQAFPLPAETGIDQLADANTARGSSFETLVLIAGQDVVDAGRALDKAVWRLDRHARGKLSGSSPDTWLEALRLYHAAIDVFHNAARADLGVTSALLPRQTEQLREQYETGPASGKGDPDEVEPGFAAE